MKKDLCEMVFILDKSGSMSGLEKDTIGGFNSMVKKQQEKDGEALVTTVLFDNNISTVHDRVGIKEIKEMTEKEYYVGGCTALLDAIGTTVEHISTIHRYAREDDVPEHTIFVITTDGMENASRKYSSDAVKKLIEQKKELGWEFIFLGANIDAVEVAGRFGVAANRAVRYECDSAGTMLNFTAMSKMVSRARKCESAAAMSAAFDCEDALEEIREDYNKRGKK